jgi:hypothetical protein
VTKALQYIPFSIPNMKQQHPDLYPDSDYESDYEEWRKLVNSPMTAFYQNGHDAALAVFSLRYQDRPADFRYRLNRFVCIQNATYSTFPQLIQDRIALSDGGDGAHIPNHLLLAMLAWYRTVPEKKMKKMPEPNWPWVLREYDRLDRLFEE